MLPTSSTEHSRARESLSTQFSPESCPGVFLPRAVGPNLGAKGVIMVNEPLFSKFLRIDAADPASVADFIYRAMEPWLGPHAENDAEGFLESAWGLDAPRARMGKLLWQLVRGDQDGEEFRQRFVHERARIEEDCARAAEVLPAIQNRLRAVVDAVTLREHEDVAIGQGPLGGEQWYLPPIHAEYVRRHIRRTHPDIVEQPSEFQDYLEFASHHLRHEVVGFFAVPCSEESREYVGEIVEDDWGSLSRVVWVRGTETNSKLVDVHSAYGQYFGWGYPGGGPHDLALSILADAVGGLSTIGDLLLPGLKPKPRRNVPWPPDLSALKPVALCPEEDQPETIWEAFHDDILMGLPMGDGFVISRADVLSWLSTKGISSSDIEALYARAKEQMADHAGELTDLEARRAAARSVPGSRLLRQRFDLVPEDFEAGLYLDLALYLDRHGMILRCTECGLPITGAGVTRRRRRWEAGEPVYHTECAPRHRQQTKRQWWSERSKDPAFRESERMRHQKKRRLR